MPNVKEKKKKKKENRNGNFFNSEKPFLTVNKKQIEKPTEMKVNRTQSDDLNNKSMNEKKRKKRAERGRRLYCKLYYTLFNFGKRFYN